MFQLKKPYALLFIILAVFSVYYSTIFAEVLSIDDHKLIENLLNKDGFTFKEQFLRGRGYYYRPINYLSYIADKYLWGLHESFMHLENMILHALNGCLVYLIADRVSRRMDVAYPSTALFAALLFAMHPIATEPVNWISGRTDLLAGFFVLSALLLLLHGLKADSRVPVILAACCFFLAPLAKETAIFWFPAALYLVYITARNPAQKFPSDLLNTLRSHAIHYSALCAVPLAYFTLRHLSIGRHDSGIGLALKGIVKVEDHDFINKVWISLKVIGFYFKKLVAPLPLNFIINSVSNWYVIAGVLVIICCLYLCWRRSLLSALLLMSACIISPALLVPLGKMALAPVAERYLYMPSAFFAVALAVGGASILHRYQVSKVLVRAVVMLVLLGAGYVTWQRNLVWQTNLSFFQDCVRQNPDFIPTRNELASALQKAGRIDEAQQVYLSNKVPATGNYHIVTEINRANVMAANKDIIGAIKLLKGVDGQESNPFYKNYLQSRLHLNGLLLQESIKPELKNAVNLENIELSKKLFLRSGDPFYYYQIGKLCMIVNDDKQAAQYFRLAAEKSPAKAFYKEPARKLAERLSR